MLGGLFSPALSVGALALQLDQFSEVGGENKTCLKPTT